MQKQKKINSNSNSKVVRAFSFVDSINFDENKFLHNYQRPWAVA